MHLPWLCCPSTLSYRLTSRLKSSRRCSSKNVCPGSSLLGLPGFSPREAERERLLLFWQGWGCSFPCRVFPTCGPTACAPVHPARL